MAEKGPFSNECEDEDKFDTEGASDSLDEVGKLCKKWENYPIGDKLERQLLLLHSESCIVNLNLYVNT